LKKRFDLEGVRGLVTQREGVSTLYVRSTLREPFDFILFLCFKLLALKMEWMVNKEKKKT